MENKIRNGRKNSLNQYKSIWTSHPKIWSEVTLFDKLSECEKDLEDEED
jgi:hypothetical protein